MKQLTRIRLVNWHLFENTTITCQGTTYFIGVNGAGKSTVLDAIQFALVGSQRDVKFNQAALATSRRTVSSYVRGELGTEGQRFLRGDTTGLVALEFANPDGSYSVHGAVIDAYADNRAPEVTYFIVHNAELNDAWFFKTAGTLFDTSAFRRHLERVALPPGGRAQVFTRLEDYRAHLLNRLGQLRDNFPSKIVKGVAFSPLTNIRDFVHNYLLDENLVDVKTLQEQLETLRHFETLVADVEARITELAHIEELDQARAASRRLRITNGLIRRQAQADVLHAEMLRRQNERSQAGLLAERASQTRDTLQTQRAAAQEALLHAQLALQTDVTAARQRALREALAAHEAEETALRRRVDDVVVALGAARAACQRLHNRLLADGQPVPPGVTQFLAENPAAPPGTAGHVPDLLHPLQAELEQLGRTYADDRALLTARFAGLRAEGSQLQGEIEQLRAGNRDTSYAAEAPAAARLRQLLLAELSLESDEVVYLCQVLQVPNEAWQDAVEGVLGAARFHLLVPPEHYDAAMRLYRARRIEDNLHGVGLPDCERIQRAAADMKAPPGDRLAVEVQTRHSAARTYVDLLLGHYVKCDTLEALRPHRTAVTRDCFVRHNYSTSHLDPRRYQRWFIGGRAIPRQIQEREERLHALGGELAECATRLAGLDERLGLTRDRVRGLIDLERDLPLLDRLAGLEAETASLRQALDELDASSLTTLEATVQGATQRLETTQTALDEAARTLGRLESQVQMLDGEIIPRLAQELEVARAAQHGYLLLEDVAPAGELAEEIAREYARRSERQPLAVVLENATRYEGDYSTAEGRSRDRLREAKQAYSHHHDFGYDDHEDAARYADERAKCVATELPDYQARVAQQRALAEQELVENFIHRLREQIENARSQLGYLNETLSRLRFGGERYEFITAPAPDLRQVYDLIMDSQAVLGASLFDSDFRRRHQEGWDLLFEWLTTGARDALAPELRRLQDYRNYLAYDIRIHYPNGDRALHSQISTKKSGGETTTPFYVAMAASFAQAYRLNQPRPADTIRLAIFDEAFGKMDSARTASALKFMVDTGLQVILATPPDKAGSLLPHVDSVRTVVRQNSHSFVLEIDKRELEELAKPLEVAA